jgi:hypothetical protein
MIAKQMELFQKSPYFQQAEQEMRRMQEQLASQQGKDPEILAFQQKQIEESLKFMENPSAYFNQLDLETFADEDEEDEEEDSDHEEDVQPAAPGQFLFDCGERKSVSKEQIAMFNEFVANQDRLRGAIESALRKMHGWMDPGETPNFPGDRVLFPKNPDDSDVPLHCFAIREVYLDPKQGRLLLSLDSQFGHFDEHGCYISIRAGSVDSFGTHDDVFADDYGDDDL